MGICIVEKLLVHNNDNPIYSISLIYEYAQRIALNDDSF